MKRLRSSFAASFAAFALLALAGTAGADVLYLGSSDGVVRSGDPVLGNFNFLAVCGGPIQSMVLDGQDLFIGDTSGAIYHYDASTGQVDYSFVAANDATALVMEGGDLLVGGSDATVLRVDKDDGTLLGTLNTTVSVGAMALIDGELYVGSPLGVVFRGDPVTGGFAFWGTCGGPIQSMTYDSTHVQLGTSAGAIYRIDRATQLVDGSFGVANDAAAMVKQAGDLLIGGTDASVLRAHRVNGLVKDSFATVFSVDAMALELQQGPGVPYCFGSQGACPCGNQDSEAGCAHSEGIGSLLSGSGTASVQADDLILAGTNLPANKNGRFYMGAAAPQIPFGDGLFCAGSGGYGVKRFPLLNSGPFGTAELKAVVAYSQKWPPQNQIAPGFTWNFQIWFRDPHGPCGGTINTSNAYRVTFLP